MSPRLVFLDVDGTLVDWRGVIPASARAAVQQARANGHLVFLCTGRSTPQLWPALIDIGYDGVVSAAGGHVEVGGRVLVNCSIPAEEVRHVIEYFGARHAAYLLESSESLFGSAAIKSRLDQLFFDPVTDPTTAAVMRGGLAAFIDAIAVSAAPEDTPVNKVLFLDSDASLDDVRDEFAGSLDVVPASVSSFGANSGELTQVGVTKASGIAAVTQHVGASPVQTMAIGDGHNDVEMLAHVKTGIAVRSAPPAVISVADDVTGTPEEDGVLAAFSRHGLL